MPEINTALEKFFPKAKFVQTLAQPEQMREKYSSLCRKSAVFTAFGGDGTLNLLVNSFYPQVKDYALIPVGTANVIANELGIPIKIFDGIRGLSNSAPFTIDIGKANNYYFLLCMGIGLDAHAVHNVSLPLKKVCGKLAYAASFMNTISTFKEPLLSVKTDMGTYQAYSMIIQNFRNFAGKHRFSTEVSPCDGKLHLVLFKTRRWGLARLALPRFLLTGKSREIEVVPFKQASIESKEASFVEIDGDPFESFPRKIEVIPDALNIHIQAV